MGIRQRDVYFLPHPYDSTVEDHPFIILSCNKANLHERTFLAVMVTTSQAKYDTYSFDLTDEMFERPLPKPDSHVRMHLVALYLEEDVTDYGKRLVTTMKPYFFNKLMEQLGDLVFNFKFQPL